MRSAGGRRGDALLCVRDNEAEALGGEAAKMVIEELGTVELYRVLAPSHRPPAKPSVPAGSAAALKELKVRC